jgi:nitroreductase
MNNSETNFVLKTIFERSSVRDFTGEAVTEEILELIIRAGMAAPSARNLQPWHFICVTSREKLNLLAGGLPYAKMLYQAAAAVIVCGTPDSEDPVLSDYWVQDCSAATENILLAVVAEGLGATWTGVYPRKDRIMHVKKVLGIPADVQPLNVIAIGVATGKNLPKDKYKPEKIHWESW